MYKMSLTIQHQPSQHNKQRHEFLGVNKRLNEFVSSSRVTNIQSTNYKFETEFYYVQRIKQVLQQIYKLNKYSIMLRNSSHLIRFRYHLAFGL